jgi:hypothetical protein
LTPRLAGFRRAAEKVVVGGKKNSKRPGSPHFRRTIHVPWGTTRDETLPERHTIASVIAAVLLGRNPVFLHGAKKSWISAKSLPE